MDSHATTPPPVGPPLVAPPPTGDRDRGDYHESDATVIGSPSSITPQNYPTGLTARELAHALRGEMLGHFLLQQFIGGGGMGVVFKALDTTLDRIVAVKVVASRHIDSDDLHRRFLVEAQSTARLDHPNIARIHYIGRDRGLPYIVFEFIDGMNLRDMAAQRGPLPVGEAVSYAYQIAHALAHAWQRDVVHRDIKPSNILVTPDGQAKLVDMGLARLKQVDEQENDLTATGITLGTFDYISPEQARDPRLADARSDIYSLGCTLFYVLAGQAPFSQGTALQKLLQHQSERPPDLRSFRSDVPDSVSRLVRRMLAKAPGDRPQTPVELVAELAAILEELEVPLPYPAAALSWTLPSRPRTWWRRHASWAVPVAALLVVGAIIDRLSRDDATAAPFPALRAPPAAPTEAKAPTTAENLGSPAVVQQPAEQPKPADDDQPPLPATSLESSLSLGIDWGMGQPLWEYFSNWPAPEATMQEAPGVLGEPAPLSPEPQPDGPFAEPTPVEPSPTIERPGPPEPPEPSAAAPPQPKH